MRDIYEIVRNCQNGQLDAFTTLFNHYQHRVYDLACTILRDETGAEDVVQDTFLAVFQKIESFQGESAFETWLTALAVNQCRMFLRKQRVRQFFSLDNLSPARLFKLSRDDDQVSEIVHSRSRRQTLWDMVDHLQERLRLPLILRYRYGFSCSDIGLILDLKTSTIYQQLHEGRSLLQQMAQEQEAGFPAMAEVTS
jgi:RNA polymerase sigma-70 factor (ECF subfamily)